MFVLDEFRTIDRQRTNFQALNVIPHVDIPGELCISDEQEKLLLLDFDYEETDGGCLRFLLALEDCCSHLCVVRQDASFECINHLTRAGRFSTTLPSAQGQSSSSDVQCEFDVLGTQLGLKDEWRAAYSKCLQQSRQLLLTAM